MGPSFAYGPATNDNDAIRLIEAAYDQGITFYDTARGLRPFRQRGTPPRQGPTICAQQRRYCDPIWLQGGAIASPFRMDTITVESTPFGNDDFRRTLPRFEQTAGRANPAIIDDICADC